MERIAPRYCQEMRDYIISQIGQSQFDAQRRRPGKLERLSALQFQELSTDVYDELNRRLNPSGSLPFLPVRDHYHPKRNQARQKLATLSDAKFVELVSDVYSELTIRYPQEPAQGSGPGRSNSGATQQQHLLYNMPQHAGSTASFSSLHHTYTNNNPSSSVIPQPRQDSSSDMRPRLGSRDPPRGDSGEYTQQQQHYNPSRSISNASSARSIQQHAEEIEKIKNEYEMRLSAMRKRVGQLEGDLMNMRMNKENANSNKGEIERLERINSKLTSKVEKLEGESAQLKAQNDSLMTKLESMATNNQRLINENADLTAKLKEAKAKIRKLQAKSVYAVDHEERELQEAPKVAKAEGALRPSTIAQYQSAIDTLLLSARSPDASGEALKAMASVKDACGQFDADVRAYLSGHAKDHHAYPLGERATSQSVADALGQLASRLDTLQRGVKSHIDSIGISPVSLLEGAASHLTTVIVDLAKAVGVRPSSAEPSGPANGASNSKQQPAMHDIEWLKDYLDEKTDAMIQGIQAMLSILRTELDCERLFVTLKGVIQTTDVTIKACQPVFRQAAENPSLIPPSFTQFKPDDSIKVLEMIKNTHLRLADLKNDVDDALALTNNSDLYDPIVVEFMDDITFKRNLTDALYDLARVNKQLVQLFE